MIGKTVSHYRILEKLGGGGMGVVYEAEDVRLHRPVAVKLLSERLAEDSAALQRFEREAQAASALNHPHICTIYDVGEQDGKPFLVMELMEGMTLKHRIGDRPLPAGEVVRLGIQIADALEAAHAAGIVHRDLKPANLFVTARGDVKVLDFGLAKITEEEPESLTALSTAALDEALTTPGTAMGTIAYMSPEQARGEDLDASTDLFSLGVVLYEMATGTRPFEGATSAVIYDEILNQAPTPARRRNPHLPEELERLLGKALEKDRELRYQSAKELMADLKRLQRDTSDGIPTAERAAVRPERQRPARLWITISAVAIVLSLSGWYLTRRAPEESDVPMVFRPLTSDGGTKSRPHLSPDGERVAYAWTGVEGDNWDIYVKVLGMGSRPLRLTSHAAADRSPVWSADGRQVAFVREAENQVALYTVPSLGGQERKLIDVEPLTVRYIPELAIQGPVMSLSWSPDGRTLAYPERSSESQPSRIVLLSLEALEKRPFTSPPEASHGDFNPVFSPDGKWLAFVRRRAPGWGPMEVWVRPTDGGKARQLTFAGDFFYNVAWAPGEKEILFVKLGGKRMFRVSLEGGAPQPILGVGDRALDPSVWGNRMVYVRLETVNSCGIWRLPGRSTPRADRVPERLIDSSGMDDNPAWSSDGRRIAFESDRDGSFNIWVSNSDGSNAEQVTTHRIHAGTPRWSPNGDRLAFDSLEAGNQDVYVVAVEGGVSRQLTEMQSEDGTPSWSRDGEWIYFHSDRSGNLEIWKKPAAGGQAVQVTEAGGFYAEESWDGRELFYSKAARSGIWRRGVQGGEEIEIVPGPIRWGDWAVSRQGIYYSSAPYGGIGTLWQRGLVIHYLDFDSGRTTAVYQNEEPAATEYLAVSADEQLLFGKESLTKSEIYLVENFR